MKRTLALILALAALFIAAPAQAQTFQSVQVGNGSCSSPAITFLNDNDTGFALASAGQISVCVGGAVVATITSSGVASGSSSNPVFIQQSPGRVNVTGTYASRTASEQAVAGDLTVSGTSLGKTGGYIAGVMGNVLGGSSVTAAGNNASNTAGVIGKYAIDDDASYTPGYPKAGVIGECAGGCDAAVVASVSEGDFPAIGERRAYYSVDRQHSPTSSVKYGLDLQGPGSHDVYGAVAFTVAGIRLPGDFCIIAGSGAPTNNVTGVNECGYGSIYIRTDSAGSLYNNTNTKANPTWVGRW